MRLKILILFLLPLLVLPMQAQHKIEVTASVGTGELSPNGLESVTCNLQDKFHQRNSVGINGAGLCVFASMKHAGTWQDDPLFVAIFDFMKSHLGGGYPSKVDEMLQKASVKYNLPIPDYIQVEDSNIDILKVACKCRYMPCVTYGVSPTGRYNGRSIAHMVNIVHASDSWFCVLDNNYPGISNYEWMTPDEFKRSYTKTGGGWCIILMTTPTPPNARN